MLFDKDENGKVTSKVLMEVNYSRLLSVEE